MALDFIEVKDATGTTRQIVGKFIDGKFQQGYLTIGRSGSATFTGTQTGPVVDVSDTPLKHFTIQAKQTGTVTSWTVVLEHSLDGVNFRPILTHTKVDNEDAGTVASGPSPRVSLYLRLRCTAISLGSGTNVVVTFAGMP
jgi:hypothetical protein